MPATTTTIVINTPKNNDTVATTFTVKGAIQVPGKDPPPVKVKCVLHYPMPGTQDVVCGPYDPAPDNTYTCPQLRTLKPG